MILQGNGRSVLRALQLEVDRLEEIKKENIEQFIINLRNELHGLWEQCFYSSEQINAFVPLHSIDFSENLLELHEAEVERLKVHYEENRELFTKVSQRQEVWNKFMELEKRAKDPSRLMNARGNSLLLEEKERSKVNKALPRLEEVKFPCLLFFLAEISDVFYSRSFTTSSPPGRPTRAGSFWSGGQTSPPSFRPRKISTGRISRTRSWPGTRPRRRLFSTRPGSAPSPRHQPS